MKRRDAFKTLTITAGGSLFIPSFIFSSCQGDSYQPVFFTEKDIPLLNEIGETILPETSDSPGAKSLNIANFIDVYVADCYSLKNQQIVREGLASFREVCMQKNGSDFMDMSSGQKREFLANLDREAKGSKSAHYFALLKSLVLFGYFTSKEGANQALRYLPVPGKYDGNYPYKPGEKAWALG